MKKTILSQPQPKTRRGAYGEATCLLCGELFTKRTNRHSYCGGKYEKGTCSYMRRIANVIRASAHSISERYEVTIKEKT